MLLPSTCTKDDRSTIAEFGTSATLAAIQCYRQLIFVKMECNKETFEIFAKNRCGMVMMDGKEKQVYDTPKGDVLFFYPSRNKMTLNKVVGRNKEMNMPIVQTEINEKEWGYGWIFFGYEVNERTINYIIKYITKETKTTPNSTERYSLQKGSE